MGPKCSQNKQQQQKRHRTREEKKLCVSFADSRIICKMFIIPFYESANKRAIVSKHTRCQQETKTQKKEEESINKFSYIDFFFIVCGPLGCHTICKRPATDNRNVTRKMLAPNTHKKIDKRKREHVFSVLFKAAAKCSRMKTQFSNHLFGDSHHRTQSCAKTLKNYL